MKFFTNSSIVLILSITGSLYALPQSNEAETSRFSTVLNRLLESFPESGKALTGSSISTLIPRFLPTSLFRRAAGWPKPVDDVPGWVGENEPSLVQQPPLPSRTPPAYQYNKPQHPVPPASPPRSPSSGLTPRLPPAVSPPRAWPTMPPRSPSYANYYNPYYTYMAMQYAAMRQRSCPIGRIMCYSERVFVNCVAQNVMTSQFPPAYAQVGVWDVAHVYSTEPYGMTCAARVIYAPELASYTIVHELVR